MARPGAKRCLKNKTGAAGARLHDSLYGTYFLTQLVKPSVFLAAPSL